MRLLFHMGGTLIDIIGNTVVPSISSLHGCYKKKKKGLLFGIKAIVHLHQFICPQISQLNYLAQSAWIHWGNGCLPWSQSAPAVSAGQ